MIVYAKHTVVVKVEWLKVRAVAVTVWLYGSNESSKMIHFASYIDRQKSGPGSSEKSQKVHSANWKEEIQLKKELDCLNKQEQQRVSRISSDQRLVVHRFQRKLSTSVDIAKNHDKVKESLDHNHRRAQELRETQRKNPNANEERMSLTQLRCLSASPKPPLPKFRRAKSCEPPKVSSNMLYGEEYANEPLDLPPRPMTALEKRNKMWERQLKTVTQRLNRARSAPARTSYYRVPEFSLVQSNARDKQTVQRHRRVTNVEIDLEYFRRVREKELYIQRQAVKTFLKSIEPLELIPWTPGYESAENNEPENVTLNSVMSAPISKQDVNTNEHRQRARSVGSAYNLNLAGSGKRGSSDRNANVINNNRVPLNAWT